MTRQNPEDRPNATQALHSFECSVNQSELERRVWPRAQSKWQRFRIQYFGANPTSFLYNFRHF
jgi:hypothetical protein